jgi:hypothetical protein
MTTKIGKGLWSICRALLLSFAMLLKVVVILAFWPIALPVWLILRSNRRHEELITAIRGQRLQTRMTAYR